MKTAWRVLLALAGAAFAAFMLWSVLFETMLPLIQAERWPELALNLAGVPLVFGGTGLLVWSAWLLLRDAFSLPGGWRRPLWMFGAAIALIALGGWLTH